MDTTLEQSQSSKTIEGLSRLPLFYKNPQYLSPDRHQNAGLRESAKLGFAAETNSVPLGANEIYQFQAHCPIVFTEGDPPLIVAVLGIGSNRNSFVDDQGNWTANVPVPAYIQRYPFIFVANPQGKEFHLAVDEAASNFSADGGIPFFKRDGTPSVMSQRALQFCSTFQQQLELALAFGAAMNSAGLLVSKRATRHRPNIETSSLDKFRIIDEAKFNALGDEVVLEFWKKQYLGMAYAHLLSMRRWVDFDKMNA